LGGFESLLEKEVFIQEIIPYIAACMFATVTGLSAGVYPGRGIT
jgi:hypothetical protein